MEHTPVTPEEFSSAEGLDDWQLAEPAIEARYQAGSFPAAASFVVRIADVAEEAQHHPDIDIRYPDIVRVMLTTHATGGLTTADLELARTISRLAADSNVTPAPVE